MEILYTFSDSCPATINGYRKSLNSWEGWGTRGAALQICRILLELLRIYEGSVTGATFLSKTARKVHEKMILKTKENVRSKDPNGINKDSSHHGFVGS